MGRASSSPTTFLHILAPLLGSESLTWIDVHIFYSNAGHWIHWKRHPAESVDRMELGDGLFGLIVDPTSVGNQIVKSINLSRDGIHDVPLVLSIQTRFTREEQTVVQAFQKFFGTRISDYMIVVFTGVGEIKYGDFDVLISCVFPEHLMISEGDVTTQVPKTKKELDDVDRKKIEKNYNAKKIIVCSISPDEYNRISAYQTTKKILNVFR
ncbi:hypothetical protein T459_02399 [Capsicum annuum]|uniref:AIG1-type G domain-containing protein n=1 Tax=Capsicum annuum TaxID=4072 RepID=A0A2G3AJV1_CAPAN|nr:hypothetical protein FXO37_15066 [Capsicum annuum]PHT94517.1 hypothetical protein T459_02399 [Capsicum annuum]